MLPLTARRRLLAHRDFRPLVSAEGFRCIPLGGYLADWVEHLAAEDPDNFRHESRRRNHYLWVREVVPSIPEVAAEIAADRARVGITSDASLDLTALLLANGESNDTYGSSRFVALDNAILHKLAACQISWDRSSSPNSERWREWGGTFEEEEHYVDMLAMAIYCPCRDRWREQPVEVGFSMPSIARLITALSTGQIVQLFEVQE